MREIPLTGGQVALVDDEDFDWLSQWNWCLLQASDGTYRYAYGKPRGARGRNFAMHRVVLEAPPGTIVDHINGDGLDNRRSNLRFCTAQQNNANRPSRNKLGFKGVRAVEGRRFSAKIMANGVSRVLGRFESVEAAARAYDAAARQYHGEFARLNFPDEAA